MARILIVDDSLVMRKVLGKIVTAQGHIIAGEAQSGREAVSEYKKLQPDVVTMDLAMPDCDGQQAISEILALYPEARVIVVSARQEKGTILDALERGARHFIPKPFSKKRVESVIDNVLQQDIDNEKRAALLKSLKEAYGLENKQAEGKTKVSARVLIVDDSAVARKSLRAIITDLGHEVVGEAENGSQAFVEYMKVKPDVVTMDLTMQGLGGAEATSKIIAADPKAKIVVISAMETRLAIIDALERGARHFIIKPIKPDKVALVIDNILHQEFDLATHLQRVRRLKEMDSASSGSTGIIKMTLPPYRISAQDNRLVHIIITDSITETSLQTLSQEIEEYLGDSIRILLDFGTMPYLSEAIVLGFGNIIQKIEERNGLVKAISNNERFAQSIIELKTETFNYLGNIIKVY
ncbi:MAG: response regulator [Pelosinus sp.]|nr:response regulator [Pelosinus sp.]